MTESKAMIIGCAGKELTEAEISFFENQQPWGLILFDRNIGDRQTTMELVSHFRRIVGNDTAPVFIDQEGGRIQRMRAPLAPDYPTAAEIGRLYAMDAAVGLRAAWVMSRLHAFDLRKVGVNADCLPVLDVPVAGAHDVIGDRAYDTDPAIVAEIGKAAAQGLLDGGVLPVMKHIPGHGRSNVDSHLQLPVVDTDLHTLAGSDFVPFKALADLPIAMTAHVVFSKIDPECTVTTSARMIGDIIRGLIGFDGLLMSDDLSMKALAGGMEKNTEALFAAGCDLALHCNGEMDEMEMVAAHTPILAGQALDRALRATRLLGREDNSDEAGLRHEFDGCLEVAA